MLCRRESYYEKAKHAVADVDDVSAARFLGWVSLAIGLTEILFPKKIQRLVGLRSGEHTGTLRVLGIRELCHGVDILSHRDPTPGVFARVAGDVLDGVLLSAAATKTKRPGGLAAAFAAVLPVVIADVVVAGRLSSGSARRRHRGLAALFH